MVVSTGNPQQIDKMTDPACLFVIQDKIIIIHGTSYLSVGYEDVLRKRGSDP